MAKRAFVAGLVIGFFLVVFGLTGSILVFYQEIDNVLNADLRIGWTGRILVFLSGLACPVLFITGLIRWLQKRKANKLKTRKSLM